MQSPCSDTWATCPRSHDRARRQHKAPDHDAPAPDRIATHRRLAPCGPPSRVRCGGGVHGAASGGKRELVWTLEHPPIYTAGTSAKARDLAEPDRFPVHVTGRGGQYTYHGPGQRIAYTMLDLKARGGDVRAFVCSLEAWVIDTLATFGVTGCVREGRVGVWVERRGVDGVRREDKIAALGIRIRRGISYHGVSLNVAPDLSHYEGIVACGLADFGITSLTDLGLDATMADVDAALQAAFVRHFGPVHAIGARGETLDRGTSSTTRP
jgi:lipoyl(octanoyl) transferase